MRPPSPAWLAVAVLVALSLAGCTAPPPAAPPAPPPPLPPSPPSANDAAPAPTPIPPPPAAPVAPAPAPAPPAAPDCTGRAPPARARDAASYAGPLFDDHFHMPQMFRVPDHPEAPVLDQDISRLDVVCLFQPDGIRGAFSFYGIPMHLKAQGLRAARDVEQMAPAAVAGFLEFVVFPGYPVDPSQIEPMVADNPGLFDGYGELSMYLPHYAAVRPDDPQMHELYALAGRHRLVVMAHPTEGQQQAFEAALRAHPNTTFLFHGAEDLSWAPRMLDALLGEFPNARYSADIRLYGTAHGRPLLDAAAGEEDFRARLTQAWNATLDQDVAFWKPLIEKHPDQFLWGTDRGAARWHYDPDVSALLEDFARAFIARLDPAVQERFAFRNAHALLAPGSPTRAG